MNHSRDPSAVLNTETLECRARRPMAAGDELTFFYPSTQWSMEEPFECRCAAATCLGIARGAKHLPAEVRERYEFNAHIVRLEDADSPREVRE